MYNTLTIKTAGLDKEHKKLFIETAKKFETFSHSRVSKYPGFVVIESIGFSAIQMLNAFEELKVPFWYKVEYDTPNRNVWEMFCEISGHWNHIVDQSVTEQYDKELEDEELWYSECQNSQILELSVS